MVWTYAAVVRAALSSLRPRVLKTVTNPRIVFGTLVLFRVGPVCIFEVAVLRAGLAYQDSAVFVPDFRIYHLKALGA